MAKGTLIQKIIDPRIVDGEKMPGACVKMKIDQTLMHDVSGIMVCLELETMGVKRIATELSMIYIDHNTMMIGPENRNDHIFAQSVAAKMGFLFSRHGNGICHQVHLERFGVPGKVLLGADSHTPTNGGLGMIGIGAGGLDIAQAIAGKPFRMVYPKIIGVELKGSLKPWVSAKDIIIKLLSMLTTQGNVGCMIEYFGDGVKSLTVPERGTITNMGAELGVTTSIFPSDEQTLKYLKLQKRESSWKELKADKNVRYDKIITIDLDSLEPMIACPSSPDNVKKVSEVGDVSVDQVLIGSCTNSSYIDLATVAYILKGRTIHPNVTLAIAPGSKQVIETLERDGLMAVMIAAGAKILESACGPCVGQGQSPAEDTVSLRTFNRNFAGRSGTSGDKVYLVSPEVAAASALTGKITSPAILGIHYRKIELPESVVINDNMIIPPLIDGKAYEIIRKSTIKPMPINTVYPEKINGKVVIKVPDKTTTDHIIPMGSFAKYRSNIPEYAKAVFNCFNEESEQTFAQKCLELKEKGHNGIIVGGLSYGQGSSREHAALCPMYLGIKAVFAKSIERIHRGNLVNFGIAPLNFIEESDYDKITLNDSIEIVNLVDQMRHGNRVKVSCNHADGTYYELTLSHALNSEEIDMIAAGGILNLK